MSNKLVTLYKGMCENENAFIAYTSIGDKNLGKIFHFLNTNYRGILEKKGGKYGGFARGFNIIEATENIARSQ
jgi:hypothetical protein